MPRLIAFFFYAAILAVSFTANSNPAVIPVESFVKFPEFTSVKISPTGKYLAVAMPDRGQTGLQIIDISNPAKGFKPKAAFRFSKLEHVMNIYWASDERVVFETTREYDLVGDIVPRLTGRIYAINADGSGKDVIFGTRRRTYADEYGFVADELIHDPDHILIYTKHYGNTPSLIEKLNIHNGKRSMIAESPFKTPYMFNGGFILDDQLNARIAYTYDGVDESMDLAVREPGTEWQIQKLEKSDAFLPIGFLPDNETLVVEQAGKPLGYFTLDARTLKRTPLLTSNVVGAGAPIRVINGRNVIGASFEEGVLRNRFIESDHPDIRLYKLLGQAFDGLHVEVTSATSDGKVAVVAVSADRLPTDYYLFNAETNKADFLLSSMQWLDPAQISARQPVSFPARDGVILHGYLTLPLGTDGADLPLVTIVHGGPHGPRDGWLFDYEAQLLASRGYAVLQTNFRGSGGYGASFEESGWLNWGRKIQDDIEDGVLWAVNEGIADKERLCVYGASFGGYSVLAQLTRNPELFKCGFAFVGIYDLEMLYDVGDIQYREEGEAYLQRVIGTDKAELRAQSPIHQVDKIKAGLYVAHGREDERAHVNHYLSLLKALDKAGVPYKSMLKHKEGHGFYDLDNRVELYSELVDFIDAHIGDDQ